MSGYQVLAQASNAIRDVLFDTLKNVKLSENEQLPEKPSAWISLAAPPEIGTEVSKLRLSLWLYFVTENEHVKNRPPTFAPDGTIKPPPLALTLYFLATPLAGHNDAEDVNAAASAAQTILGAVLEAFHNRPIIRLQQPATATTPATNEELHLSLCRLSLEELTRVWEALKHSYRLSVCFKVNVVRIESGNITFGQPVVEREFIAGRSKQDADQQGAAR